LFYSGGFSSRNALGRVPSILRFSAIAFEPMLGGPAFAEMP